MQIGKGRVGCYCKKCHFPNFNNVSYFPQCRALYRSMSGMWATCCKEGYENRWKYCVRKKIEFLFLNQSCQLIALDGVINNLNSSKWKHYKFFIQQCMLDLTFAIRNLDRKKGIVRKCLEKNICNNRKRKSNLYFYSKRLRCVNRRYYSKIIHQGQWRAYLIPSIYLDQHEIFLLF